MKIRQMTWLTFHLHRVFSMSISQSFCEIILYAWSGHPNVHLLGLISCCKWHNPWVVLTDFCAYRSPFRLNQAPQVSSEEMHHTQSRSSDPPLFRGTPNQILTGLNVHKSVRKYVTKMLNLMMRLADMIRPRSPSLICMRWKHIRKIGGFLLLLYKE